MRDIKACQTEMINTIKLLIYKENPDLLERIDFDDDNLFLEPLLFFYFNHKIENYFSNELLVEIMQGYFLDKQDLEINHSFSSTSSIAYLPKLGYFNKEEPIPFDKIQMIENTNIEVFIHPVDLLQNIFKNISGNILDYSQIDCSNKLFNKNINYLTNALSLIKENSKEHFNLIELCCQKILIFKTDTNNTNSFASINAHGIVFLNVYQDDYDEVFFVDDIAHQTGHIILTTLFYNRKAIFKINEEQNVEDIIKLKDHRTVYILFHALYTYYATFLCLDDCLKNNKFKEKQRKEAIARIGFYLIKCSFDLSRLEEINKFYNGKENVLTLEGIEIYNLIRKKYLEISKKWHITTKYYNYNNQPYNFTMKNFDQSNFN
ncbi:MAG: hypothetical protein J7574_02090 [Flavobacterium sp.]|uniref:hypothetical protein n=1 Tax=Flavobacterium sp. TaxID=239 RepID=UPI001B0C2AAD|nr:hypothetical protein [Flavobacterium sp.]MBO9582929.1 hypothetical protein [Flavobacterium sp.]